MTTLDRDVVDIAPPAAPRSAAPRTAVLDSAHVGDIEGALGRISISDTDPPRTLKVRLLTLLAIVGPGLIVMVGDNDAGGVATYTQAGQNYGYSLLWVLLLLIPVLIVNQEMVVRLGAVTGVGHARLINERFGRGWGWFSVGDLFLLNFLTLVTEFIGVTLAADYIGIPRYVVVPFAAVALIAIMATGSFKRWERAMLVFIAITLVQVPMLLMAHPDFGHAAKSFVVPGVTGGVNSDAVLLIIAMVGTTVAPWQLFFQQSNIVDKRITPRFIGYERADTTIGAFVVVAGAAALVMTGDWAARATHSRGSFVDAGVLAHLLGQHNHALGSIFAIVLLDASIIGAAAVTLSSSYAFGDVFGLKHSLHRGFADAKPFYFSYTGMVVIAAAIVLIPGAPLGLITTGVQALAGLLLPSATVFLLLLCNDRQVLGPWVNRPWLNVVRQHHCRRAIAVVRGIDGDNDVPQPRHRLDHHRPHSWLRHMRRSSFRGITVVWSSAVEIIGARTVLGRTGPCRPGDVADAAVDLAGASHLVGRNSTRHVGFAQLSRPRGDPAGGQGHSTR
jgi:Mn2+/Fe2+ NRAMP family transporter